VDLRRNRPPRGKAASFSGSRPGLNACRLEENLFIADEQVDEHLGEQVGSDHKISPLLISNKIYTRKT
jgi:hypothetical protein